MERTVADLQRLCRQPSVAAEGVGIRQAAELVAALGQEAGGRVRILDDCGGNPVVSIGFDPGQAGADRTLLYYNHYDVQPVGAPGLWSSPPFAAEIRSGKLYARGAADNKGELIARLAAVRKLREQGALPCRVRFLVEGEEEIGSPTLQKVLDRHGSLFAADACVWEFGDVDVSGRPQLYGGVKGMAFLLLSCQSASTDLHSGMGALVDGAAWRLVQALATLKDAAGRIQMDGFYETVRRPDLEARRLASQIPFDKKALRAHLALKRPLLNERDPVHALCFEPTCTICGLEAGHLGGGAHTVLPGRAQAKLDCRLVPDQDPVDIAHKVRRHLYTRGFPDIEVELLSGMPAFRTDPAHPFVGLVRETARQAWGAEPVFHPSSAGTGPMYLVARALHLPIVSTGCGWFGSQAHGPDESIRLTDLERGIGHQILLLQRFGAYTRW